MGRPFKLTVGYVWMQIPCYQDSQRGFIGRAWRWVWIKCFEYRVGTYCSIQYQHKSVGFPVFLRKTGDRRSMDVITGPAFLTEIKNPARKTPVPLPTPCPFYPTRWIPLERPNMALHLADSPLTTSWTGNRSYGHVSLFPRDLRFMLAGCEPGSRGCERARVDEGKRSERTRVDEGRWAPTPRVLWASVECPSMRFCWSKSFPKAAPTGAYVKLPPAKQLVWNFSAVDKNASSPTHVRWSNRPTQRNCCFFIQHVIGRKFQLLPS